MNATESQQRFFELIAVVLEWMPWITLGVAVLLILQLLAFCWFRNILHKKGIMHRNYDGLEDGYTWIHLITGKRPPDEHLWEQDESQSSKHTTQS